jgi:hypothetical protein
MDAIDRTDIDAGGILHAYAGLSNNIGHLIPPKKSNFQFTSKTTWSSQLNPRFLAGLP